MNKKQTTATDVALPTATTYKLAFNGKPERWTISSLEQLIEAIFENELEPDYIIMPNGLLLQWNGFAAHSYVVKGRINRREFLQACLVTKGGES